MNTVIFTLKQYLDDQAAINHRSDGGKQVPSQNELAAIVGRHKVTFSRIVNNKSDTISMSVLADVITELRQRGFSPSFDDLFAYHE